MIINTARTSRGEVEYVAFGTGKTPLVILPGVGVKAISQSAKAIENAYSCFAEDYTVYVIDRKKSLEPDCSLESITDDTAEAMISLGIANACVFGASMGGMLAQYLAIKYPELVRALVLGSTVSRVRPVMAEIGEKWIRLAEARERDALLRSMIDNLYSDSTRQLFGEDVSGIFDAVSDGDLDWFVLQMRALLRLDILDQLDLIACPALVIGVDGDRVVTGEASDELAEALCCEQYMYGGEYGHCAFDEAPDYKERLLNFFNRIIN